jgi:hypothetical protein
MNNVRINTSDCICPLASNAFVKHSSPVIDTPKHDDVIEDIQLGFCVGTHLEKLDLVPSGLGDIGFALYSLVWEALMAGMQYSQQDPSSYRCRWLKGMGLKQILGGFQGNLVLVERQLWSILSGNSPSSISMKCSMLAVAWDRLNSDSNSYESKRDEVVQVCIKPNGL